MLDRVALAAVAALLMAAPLQAQDQMSKETAMANAATASGHLNAAKGHKASGQVTVHSTAVVFGKDFSVEHSPDAYVVLSNGSKVMEGSSLYLGKLVQFSGTQSFGIPAGTDLSKYTHVILWDKRAGTEIASAKLPHGGMEGHGAMKPNEMSKNAMKKN